MITPAEPAPATVTIREILAWATGELASRSDSPRLDAEVLLGHVIERSRAQLLARPELALTLASVQHYRELIARRAQGEPVAYLTGWREFWSRRFRVTPATLIPRPETELLVEMALDRLPTGSPRRIADLGAGSGAIALTLALERPTCRVTATDISRDALDIARGNARTLGADNVEFQPGDWCGPLDGKRYDMIISNPPYIDAFDPHLLQGDLPHEPATALTPGENGLEAIERIVATAPTHLVRGGWLLLEHGYEQAAAVAALLEHHGYTGIEQRRDFGGHLRAVAARHDGSA
ncbi:MAG: peptide chain release factor N(5)-glutamine methyltransferase [Gammaproteobacteria bacterium]|nr:peptide chain release factor N(5)-glutamine methyltransferase [Gammaproteobacteria bacterium]